MNILNLITSDTNRKARKLLGHPLTKREIYLFIYLDACLKDHIEYSEKFMTSYDKDIILSLNYMGLLRAASRCKDRRNDRRGSPLLHSKSSRYYIYY